MKILIAAATSFEIEPAILHMEKEGRKASFFHYEYQGHEVYPIISGIGSLKMAFALARYPGTLDADITINAGIAGAYDKERDLGSVVHVTKDRFADLGVEESDGTFTDVYDLGLEEKNRFPFSEGWLINDQLKYTFDIPEVNANTVNTVHGSTSSIEQVRSKYPADIESMEGAGFMYACKSLDLQYVQLRALSNYVEPRNRDGWKVELAIENLNQSIIKLLDHIEKPVANNGFDWFS